MSDDVAEAEVTVTPDVPIEPAERDFVRVLEVTREYPARGKVGPTVALESVSLRVAKGSVVAIQGDSGSGKTTLLNLIGGLDRPTSGEVIIGDQNLGDLNSRELASFRAKTVGFVFQEFNLLPDLTALENVLLAMEAGSPLADEERAERAFQLLEAVGIKKRVDYFPGSLSGGQKQRVAIARAIANEPQLILADEPTGNLDPNSRHQVMNYILDLSRKSGVTVIVVTHESQIADLCDNVFMFREGRGRHEGKVRLVRWRH
ncbi:MAG: ABC transporter ATP-binding protein [Thermoplasmata archaeon]